MGVRINKVMGYGIRLPATDTRWGNGITDAAQEQFSEQPIESLWPWARKREDEIVAAAATEYPSPLMWFRNVEFHDRGEERRGRKGDLCTDSINGHVRIEEPRFAEEPRTLVVVPPQFPDWVRVDDTLDHYTELSANPRGPSERWEEIRGTGPTPYHSYLAKTGSRGSFQGLTRDDGYRFGIASREAAEGLNEYRPMIPMGVIALLMMTETFTPSYLPEIMDEMRPVIWTYWR